MEDQSQKITSNNAHNLAYYLYAADQLGIKTSIKENIM